MTGPDLMAIRSAASALEQVSFYFGGEMGVQLGGHAEFVGTYLVTQNFFSVFGVVPMFGHGFGTSGREGDQQHGAIVSLPFAQRNFGSGAAALGQILHMEGVAYEIVGVVPARFRFPPEAQMWLEVPRISRPWEFLFYVGATLIRAMATNIPLSRSSVKRWRGRVFPAGIRSAIPFGVAWIRRSG